MLHKSVAVSSNMSSNFVLVQPDHTGNDKIAKSAIVSYCLNLAKTCVFSGSLLIFDQRRQYLIGSDQGCQHCVSKKSGNSAKCLTSALPQAIGLPSHRRSQLGGGAVPVFVWGRRNFLKNRVKILGF